MQGHVLGVDSAGCAIWPALCRGANLAVALSALRTEQPMSDPA
jgi:hypothetical protein